MKFLDNFYLDFSVFDFSWYLNCVITFLCLNYHVISFSYKNTQDSITCGHNVHPYFDLVFEKGFSNSFLLHVVFIFYFIFSLPYLRNYFSSLILNISNLSDFFDTHG